VYEKLPLTGDDKVLEQVVKPAASAKIASTSGVVNACLDSEVELDVLLYGEAPFNLEWEIVHDGKRKSERVTGVQDNSFRIKTNALRKGGEYILALSSVQDKRGCKTFLQDQVKIAVRRQQPRAAFGFVEHKQKLMAVEDTHLRLPLRLEGEPPFEISYRNLNGNGEVLTKRANNANDNLLVKSQGVYELVNVRDNQCPGSVVPTASRFEVGWYPRPEISIVESPSISSEGSALIKQSICEGDIDGFEVNLKGKRFKPRDGTIANILQDRLLITWSTRSHTSLYKAPRPSAVKTSTPHSQKLPSPWILPRLAITATSSLL
jgi:nucleoporin POM152